MNTIQSISMKNGIDNNGNQKYTDINVYSSLPDKWIKSSYTIINNIEYQWIHENKSLFAKDGRESGLLLCQ